MTSPDPERIAWPERDLEPADFIGALRDVVFRTRGKTYWSYLSPAWTTLTGYSVEECLGCSILDVVYPDDRPENSLRKQQLEAGQLNTSRHIKRLLRRDGSFVWIEVDLRVLYGEDGSFQGSVGTIRDISDRVALEEAIRHERELASATVMALSDGVLTLDATDRIEFLNHAAADLLGLQRTTDALDSGIEDVLALETHDIGTLIADARAEAQPRTLGGRCRLRGATSGWSDVELSVIPLSGADGGSVIVLHDVREQRALQAKLSHQARHDALTQTLNRSGMLDELRRAHAAFCRTGTSFCLILVDLDHFKLVNDHHGHAAGDEALRQSALAIQGALRNGDHLARWGGEEYLCLLPHTTLEQGVIIAEGIRAAVQALELAPGGQPMPLTLSAGGSATAADRADTLEQVLQRADFALYEAKQAGRNCVWHERMAGQGVLGRISPVREALRAERLDLAYQPIVSLTTGEPVGQEALARLRLDDGTELKAGRFMPALQQLHRAHWVDEQVIPRVLDACLRGTLQGDCFVNLSADMLRRPTLMQALLQTVMQRLGDPPQTAPLARLVLELDLGGQPHLEPQALHATLQPWLEAGARLAFNASGAGLTALGYWASLPIAFLKVHASLLAQAAASPRAHRILAATIQLARQLDCLTVAEQVDEPELVTFARALGFDCVQGHLSGAPLAASD